MFTYSASVWLHGTGQCLSLSWRTKYKVDLSDYSDWYPDFTGHLSLVPTPHKLNTVCLHYFYQGEGDNLIVWSRFAKGTDTGH